jgi:hypothetical protein
MNDLRVDWIILLFAMIFGFLLRKKSWYPQLSTLPLFLLLTLVVELIGRYYRLKSINNIPLFNTYSVLQLCYFTWLLYKIQLTKTKKYLLIIIPTLCIINIVWIQGIKTFHTYSYAVAVILIVGLCIRFLISVFKEAQSDNLLKEPNFWFVIGILTYYTTSLSILGIMNYISVLPPEMIKLTRKALLNVNSIFYILLLIGFLCKMPTLKYTRNS